MKNLKPEYKNKIYVAIVLIFIIVILIVALFLLSQQENVLISNDNTTTTLSTTIRDDSYSTTTSTTSTTTNVNGENTTTTTTTTEEIDNNKIAYNAIKKYLNSFYIDNYIRSYDIKDIEILNEVECHKLSENGNKIYALVDLTYEKINLNVEINPNEELIQDNNFNLNIIFIINKTNNNIEDLKKAC